VSVVEPAAGSIITGDLLGEEVIFIEEIDDGEVSIGITRIAGAGGVDGYGTVARAKFRVSVGAQLYD
jgi:hypothetical protein